MWTAALCVCLCLSLVDACVHRIVINNPEEKPGETRTPEPARRRARAHPAHASPMRAPPTPPPWPAPRRERPPLPLPRPPLPSPRSRSASSSAAASSRHRRHLSAFSSAASANGWAATPRLLRRRREADWRLRWRAKRVGRARCAGHSRC